MLLTIIICTYKRPKLLQNCISCALKILSNIDAELIVINDDNGSDVQVPIHPKVKLIHNSKKGLASARNIGAQNASGDLLLFIDDDIEFELGNVTGLLKLYQDQEPACYNPNWKYSDEVSAVVKNTSFGRFLIAHGLVNYKGWVPQLNWQNKVFEVKTLAGFFMLIPKYFFLKVGGFNEFFVNQGTEDDELCKRLVELKIKMFIDPNNYVYHNEIDRLSLESRLMRYNNGAINRRKAFDLGHQEYEIKYRTSKRLLIIVLLPFYKWLIKLAHLIPNKISFDFIYFKIAHILIAISIYKGYSKT